MPAIAISLLLLAVILAAAFQSYRIAFYTARKTHVTPDDPLHGLNCPDAADAIQRLARVMQRIPSEDVTICAYDGIPLHARYYHSTDGAPVVIFFHGYRSCALRDCGGAHAFFHKIGFNLLVVDQRAHGESGGRTITFGIRERLDCMSWTQYTAARFGSDTPVVLYGLSLGAATVLMASDLALPRSVRGIIADSPFASPSAIIEKVCRDLRYPVVICRPLIHIAAFLYGGFRLGSSTAVRAVQHTEIPVLLIHGEDDSFVPCAMSEQIAAACASRVTLATFPGADHGLSYLVDPMRYERTVYEFLNADPSISKHISDAFRESLGRQ